MVIIFIEDRFLDVCRISYYCPFRFLNTRHVFFSNSYQVQRQRWTGKIEQTKPWLIFTGKRSYPCLVSKRFDFVMSVQFWDYHSCKGSKNFHEYCHTCMLLASLIQHFGCKVLDMLEHLVEWCSKLLDHWSDLKELRLLGPFWPFAFWPRDLVCEQIKKRWLLCALSCCKASKKRPEYERSGGGNTRRSRAVLPTS